MNILMDAIIYLEKITIKIHARLQLLFVMPSIYIK